MSVGIYKRTKEHNRKIGKANAKNGTLFPKGHIPWNKGRRVSIICGQCDKKFDVIMARKNKTKYCSKKCQSLAKVGVSVHIGIKRPDIAGSNNWNWKGGMDESRLKNPTYIRQRNKAYIRDNYICQECKTKCVNRKETSKDNRRWIQCHHIDDRNNHDINNLKTLCLSCHSNFHRLNEPIMVITG